MKLKDLPIHAKVRDSKCDLIFLVAAQNHPDYKGTTLICEKVIGVGCYDASEPENVRKNIFEDAEHYGNNCYAKSAIHQWLNAEASDWYRKTHESDMPPSAEYCRYGEQPYDQTPGFLGRFSDLFKNALAVNEVPVLERTSRDEGTLVRVKAKFFLPSRTELCKGDESGFAEGHVFPLFYDPTVFKTSPTREQLELHGRSWNPEQEEAKFDAPQLYDPKYGWWYWMRTPSLKYSFLNRVASPYGAVSYTYSNNDIVGIRPVCSLDGETEVYGDGEIDECFTLIN